MQSVANQFDFLVLTGQEEKFYLMLKNAKLDELLDLECIIPDHILRKIVKFTNIFGVLIMHKVKWLLHMQEEGHFWGCFCGIRSFCLLVSDPKWILSGPDSIFVIDNDGKWAILIIWLTVIFSVDIEKMLQNDLDKLLFLSFWRGLQEFPFAYERVLGERFWIYSYELARKHWSRSENRN